MNYSWESLFSLKFYSCFFFLFFPIFYFFIFTIWNIHSYTSIASFPFQQNVIIIEIITIANNIFKMIRVSCGKSEGIKVDYRKVFVLLFIVFSHSYTYIRMFAFLIKSSEKECFNASTILQFTSKYTTSHYFLTIKFDSWWNIKKLHNEIRMKEQ